MINFQNIIKCLACCVSSFVGVMLLWGQAFAQSDFPSVSLVRAPLVPLGAASTFYGTSSVHTVGIAARVSTPPEIAALSVRLGSGKLSESEYTQSVFTYVRNNIGTEFRYGLSKGGLGALIDKSGTPFDQAELVVLLLREGGVVSNYRAGIITLTASQFISWTGFASSINEASQENYLDARAACNFLADGGIPAIVNGQADCSLLAGNLASVQMSSVWVEAAGFKFDASYKTHSLRNQINLPAVMGCVNYSQCASEVKNSLTAQGNLNEAAHSALMQQYAVNLQAYVEAIDRSTTLEEFLGYKRYDPDAQAVVSSVLPYTTLAQTLWIGDVPDQYRTKVRVQVPGVDQSFYADELAGRIIVSGTVDGNGNSGLFVDDIFIGTLAPVTYVTEPLPGGAGTQTVEVAVSATLSVDHPYAALSGTYADQQSNLKLTTGTTPKRIFFAFGSVGPSFEQYIDNREKRQTTGLHNDQSYAVAQYLSRETKANRDISKLLNSEYSAHHIMFVVMHTPQDIMLFNYQSAISVASSANDDGMRLSSFRAIAAADSVLEGSVIQQLSDSFEGLSGVSYLVLANRSGNSLLQVNSANINTVLPTLINYTSDMKSRIQAMVGAGYDLILTQNESLGSFSVLNGTVSLGGAPVLATRSFDSSYLIDTYYKGGMALGGNDPYLAALDASKIKTAKLLSKQASVDAYSGVLNLSPPPDLTTGFGENDSLNFQRYYSSARPGYEGLTTVFESSFLGMPVPGLTGYTGVGSAYSQLGAGWTHNWDIAAQINNDSSLSMGENTALEGARYLASIAALTSTAGDLSYQGKMTTVFTAYWMSKGFMANSVTVKLPPSEQTFVRLPNGTYFNSGDLASHLYQTGEKSQAFITSTAPTTTAFGYGSIGLSYVSSQGDVIIFSPANSISGTTSNSGNLGGNMVTYASSRFRASTLTQPNGQTITFDYQTYHDPNNPQIGATYYVLNGVHNNFGRSLVFGLQPTNLVTSTGLHRISSVSDENGRSASFQLSDCPTTNFTFIEMTCRTFKSIGVDGQATKYSYLEDGTPSDSTRGNYFLSSWYSPKNTVLPIQTYGYDVSGGVTETIDVLGNHIKYYTGGIFSDKFRNSRFYDALNGLTLSWHDDKGRMLKAKDPLGRVVLNFYDKSGRLSKTISPEGNGTQYYYDVRSNIIQERIFSKSCNFSAISCDDDINTFSTYVEGPAVYQCLNTKSCNKPQSKTDAKGKTTEYTWDSSTGNLLQIKPPAVYSAIDSANINPIITLNYTLFNGVSLLSLKTEKISGNVATSTSYDYDINNHLVLKSVVSDVGGLNVTSLFKVNNRGDVIAIDGPLNSTIDERYIIYDISRKPFFEISADPDGAESMKRSIVKHIYDADGLETLTQIGTGIAIDGSDFTVSSFKRMTYDAVGQLIKTEIGQP